MPFFEIEILSDVERTHNVIESRLIRKLGEVKKAVKSMNSGVQGWAFRKTGYSWDMTLEWTWLKPNKLEIVMHSSLPLNMDAFDKAIVTEFNNMGDITISRDGIQLYPAIEDE